MIVIQWDMNTVSPDDWFIQNKICRSKDRYTVGGAICYALSHSGRYFGIKIEEKEKVIVSHYE